MKEGFSIMRAVIFDVGGVLAQDVWEHLLLDEAAGGQPPGIAWLHGLNPGLVERVGSLLWESYAYMPETKPNDWC